MIFKREFTAIGVSKNPNFPVIQLRSENSDTGVIRNYPDENPQLDLPPFIKTGSKLTIVFTSTPDTGNPLDFRVVDLNKTDDFYIGYDGDANHSDVRTILVLASAKSHFNLVVGRRRAYRVFKKALPPGTVFSIKFE